ncbi:MAG: DNA-processing protein DprA [Bacillota bacterium]
MEGALIWLIYGRARGVGRQRLAALMEHAPDAHSAWNLRQPELAGLPGFNPGVAEALVAIRKDPDARREAERDLERARAAGLRLLLYHEPHYPAKLRQIPDPPPVLYQAGPWEPDQRPAIAIVGTRKPTAYGLAVAERLGRELSQLGADVISGMARGIDSAAHRGALSEGGTSVAVLGGGADLCYPREATTIYRAMKERGGILSEQPPGTEPRRENFPERNRIISGLCDGVIVVEAGERSGTLITVTHALSQGREVFAVPGPITSPMSVGPHRLIREGACLVESGRQVLEELGFVAPAEGPIHRSLPSLSPEEQRLLGWMGHTPRRPDELAEACGLQAAEVQATLTMLEIRGAVRRLPGGEYLRTIAGGD